MGLFTKYFINILNSQPHSYIHMVTIYVLRLVDNKFYVGMTTRNLARIWEHVEGEGAKWTKKYPPIKGNEVKWLDDRLFPLDENRITLEMMRDYGIENVRGGSWCQMKLTSRQIYGVKKRIRELPPKKSKSRPEVGEYYKKRALKKKYSRKKRAKNKLRGVLLPFGTEPINQCRAMKMNGAGRCRKPTKSNFAGNSSNDQLCNMHRISVLSGRRPWPTVDSEGRRVTKQMAKENNLSKIRGDDSTEKKMSKKEFDNLNKKVGFTSDKIDPKGNKLEAIEIEKLKIEIIRMKTENREKIRNIRKLAKKEIEDISELKDIDITLLELENEVLEEEKFELKNEVDLLKSLSLEYHISKEVSKAVKRVKRNVKKTKKGVAKEVKKEVKKSIKVAKKAGKKLRKKTGL